MGRHLMRPRAADLLAGLSVAGLLLPEAVAYAQIGGLPPAHAIAAAVAGLTAYAILGRSRFAIVAPTSSSAAILTASLAQLATADPTHRMALGFAIVGMAGAFFIAAGVARLGSLAAFISRPVLRGFAFGLAITIVVKQLPLILGVSSASGMPFHVLTVLATHFAEWNGISTAIGAGALALLLGLKRLPSIPGAFVVLVVGIALASVTDLTAHGVTLVGAIDISDLAPGIPDVARADWLRAGQLALPLFLIVYAESWGSIRNLALRHGDITDPNRELIALGAANVASAFVQGMPVGAGFSASSANEGAGGQSRLAGAAAAVAVVVLILAGGRLFARLPEPVLAAVVVAALMHALNPQPLVTLFRVGRDLWVALAGVAGVLLFGVLDGMLIAIGLSLATAIQRFARPNVSQLGQLGDTRNFVDTANHPEAVTVPEIAIYRPNAPLFFANAERVFAEIGHRIAAAPGVRKIILSLEESSDLDSTAAEALIEFAHQVTLHGHSLLLARTKDELQARLRRANGGHLVAEGTCFRSVADAATAALNSARH